VLFVAKEKMEANVRITDDADECEGLPTHVQVVGKSMMDEELVEIMKVVERVLKD
jgi:Asp-tRNA(Asn)/Glu-tRNA(Gln) amidotransferase A subunit family amidase